MNFHIISLFPDSMSSYLRESILKRAIEDKKISVNFSNPRDFTKDKWKRIDQKPYGGGPGMVIQAEPVIKAIEKAISKKGQHKNKKDKNGVLKKTGIEKIKIVFLSPGGKQFTTEIAKKWAKDFSKIIIVSGRYEGIDERVNKVFKTEKISVGPYVLTGGELPALAIIDSVSRQVPGVLGNEKSREEERISARSVYTRPEVFKYKNKTYKVPKVLIQGDHKKIEEWKLNN